MTVTIDTTFFLVSAENHPTGNINVAIAEIDGFGNTYLIGETESNDIFIRKQDPSGNLLWNETFGGSQAEFAKKFLIDSTGDLYLIGSTLSSDYNVTENAYQTEFGGATDYFIRKWTPDGQLLWSTYLGGTNTEPFFVTINPLRMTANNELIIFGWTNSDDFPTTETAFQPEFRGSPSSTTGFDGDMFITKIMPSGQIAWSSYFGSSGFDYAEMLLDREENIILLGSDGKGDITDSLMVGGESKGGREPYVVKISQDGEIIFSRYFGGSEGDAIWGTVIDSQNNIISMGNTQSDDFPTVNTIQDTLMGVNDLYFVKFDPTGVILWSTYFGGSGLDALNEEFFDRTEDRFAKVNRILDNPRIRIDSEDNLIFLTRTSSTDLDLIHPIIQQKIGAGIDSFVGKFSPNGTLLYGSYFDATLMDAVITGSDDVFITGQLETKDWILTADASQSDYGGDLDIGYAILNSNNSLTHSSFLGGSGADRLVKGYVTPKGNYLILGTTDSTDLPNAINEFGGGTDIFLCIISSTGTNEWCRYVGGTASESINDVGIILQPNGEIMLIGITTSDDFPGIQTSSKYDHAAFATTLNENGEMLWTSVVLTVSVDEPEDDDNNLVETLTVALLLSAIVSVSYFLRVTSLKSKKFEELLLNENMTNILSPIFHNNAKLIHIFGATKVFSDERAADEIQSNIPMEIMDFKYFLHPVRLSIVKLLDENVFLTSVQIRDYLSISWSELSNHLSSLKKRGLVSINQEFIEGSTRMVVSAEGSVISQFQSLKEIVLEFFDATPNLERYLDQVTQVKMRVEDQELYPDNY